MRGKRHGMHPGSIQTAKVHRDLAHSLDRIRVKPRPGGPGLASQPLDILHHASFVVGQHQRNQLGLLLDEGG